MSGLTEAQWIWRNGELIPWAEARVHVLSMAVQFGTSVFEGIRCYATPSGPAVFRLQEHIRRLFDSCRIYRLDVGYTREEIISACLETVSRNDLESCYIRPMVVLGYGAPGMTGVGSPVEVFICAWPWGPYLGEGALEAGVDVCVSSWHRPAPNTFPSAAKAAGHYNNAQLIKWEAMANGYIEAIALGPDGRVSEGSGQNLFLVRDGVLITPPLDGTNLSGITRDAVLRIAEDLGVATREQPVPRESLYTADEVFFSGTASEITPIRSIDRIPVGAGRMGPLTRQLQRRFLAIAHGEEQDRYGWLTHVRHAPHQVEEVAL